MHVFDVLGHPVRRRVLEVLEGGEHSSGDLVDVIEREFGITQSAVSQHLRILRDHGFATFRVDGARRIYALDPAPLKEADGWLEQFRGTWDRRLDALGTEVARGKRDRREVATTGPERTPKGGGAGSSVA